MSSFSGWRELSSWKYILKSELLKRKKQTLPILSKFKLFLSSRKIPQTMCKWLRTYSCIIKCQQSNLTDSLLFPGNSSIYSHVNLQHFLKEFPASVWLLTSMMIQVMPPNVSFTLFILKQLHWWTGLYQKLFRLIETIYDIYLFGLRGLFFCVCLCVYR